MKELIFILLVSTLSFSQSISKQVIGTAGKTQTNSNLKVSWTTGEPVVGLMTAGGNQLGNGYYPAMDIQALSIDDATINLQIKVYPNPTDGKFTFEIGDIYTGEVGEAKIINVLGETIYQTQVRNFKSEIDLSNVQSGMYFLQVLYGKQIYNKQIVIE